MNCPNCQYANDATARFCAQCGAALPALNAVPAANAAPAIHAAAVVSAPAAKGSNTALIVIVAIVGILALAWYGFHRFETMIGDRIANVTGSPRAQQTAPQASSSQPPADAGTQQGAATVGNVIGNMLGTDDKGKAGLGAALNNLAQAGQQIEKHDQAQQAQGQNTIGIPNGTDAQNAMNATGGLLSALGGALGGSHRVIPVDFHTLESMLPAALPGMQRGTPEGSSKQGMGIHGTSASVDFKGADNTRINVAISDISGVSGLIDLAGNLAHTEESESASGFEKDIIIDGRSVHEKYDNGSKHGEISVIVAKRFEVDVSGDHVDMEALQLALAQVDLGHLESMKDANAR